MVNALALIGDEGRDKLRKASGRCKQPLIRRYPNGATYFREAEKPFKEPTQGTETSKYLEEEKTIVIPQVVASERGEAQTSKVKAFGGL